MPNLRIFGSPIHDTAIVMIVTTTISSTVFYMMDNFVGRTEANVSLLFGAICSVFYWYTQYKVKK